MLHVYVLIVLVFPDLIDIVKEQLYGHDYAESEDPKLYISSKTMRGPLSENWLEDYWNEVLTSVLFPTLEPFFSLLSILHKTLLNLLYSQLCSG